MGHRWRGGPRGSKRFSLCQRPRQSTAKPGSEADVFISLGCARLDTENVITQRSNLHLQPNSCRGSGGRSAACFSVVRSGSPGRARGAASEQGRGPPPSQLPVSPHGKRDCGPRTSPAPTGYSRGCGCPWSPGSARDGRACSGSGWCPAATPRLGVFLLGAGGLPSHSAEVTHLGPERVNTVNAAPSSPSAFLRPRRRVSCVVKASGTASAPRERRRLPGVPPPRPGRAPVHSDQPRAARSCLNDRLRSVPRKRLHVL